MIVLILFCLLPIGHAAPVMGNSVAQLASTGTDDIEAILSRARGDNGWIMDLSK